MSKFSIFAFSVCLTGVALLGLGGSGAGLSGGVVSEHRSVVVAVPVVGSAQLDSNGWWSDRP
jgi:hypothetical protein